MSPKASMIELDLFSLPHFKTWSTVRIQSWHWNGWKWWGCVITPEAWWSLVASHPAPFIIIQATSQTVHFVTKEDSLPNNRTLLLTDIPSVRRAWLYFFNVMRLNFSPKTVVCNLGWTFASPGELLKIKKSERHSQFLISAQSMAKALISSKTPQMVPNEARFQNYYRDNVV